MSDYIKTENGTIFEREWACEDCLLSLAGWTDDEVGRELPVPYGASHDVVSVSTGWPRAWCDTDHTDDDEHSWACEQLDFTRSRCDSCGTDLAGARHAVAVEYGATLRHRPKPCVPDSGRPGPNG